MIFSGVQKFTVLDFPEKIACIAFVPGCDFRCGYCHNPEFVLPEKICALRGSFISAEVFLNFLRRRRGLLEGVVVSGGEPTLARDLPEFIRKVKNLGFAVKLDTNGNRPAVLARLIEEKLLDYVAMDFKTAPDYYRSLVGEGVKVENILASVALLKKSSLPHEFRSTLIKEVHTDAVLAEMVESLAGVDRLYLQRFRNGQTLSPEFALFNAFSEPEMEKTAALFRTKVGFVGWR